MNYRIVYSDEIEHGLFNSIKKNHKYIKRERNAAGRWVYTYTDDRKEATKLTEEDLRLARIQFNRTNKSYHDVNENDYSKYKSEAVEYKNKAKIARAMANIATGSKKEAYEKEYEKYSELYKSSGNKATAAKRDAKNKKFQAEIAFQKYDDVVAQYQKQQKYDKVINKIKSVFKIK